MDAKFPRTSHLSFSESIASDDIVLASTGKLFGRECIATIKMDGENSSMLRTHYHARSIDSRHHPSRDWLKKFHGEIAHLIPEDFRICGENLYAKHSIFYENLESYFYGFSVWDGRNVALSWDETLVWFDLLGIKPVPTLMRGVLDKKMYQELQNLTKTFDTTKNEGFVLRVTDEIPYDEYGSLVAKWVRKNHVQTDEHWMFAEIVPNQLRSE